MKFSNYIIVSLALLLSSVSTLFVSCYPNDDDLEFMVYKASFNLKERTVYSDEFTIDCIIEHQGYKIDSCGLIVSKSSNLTLETVSPNMKSSNENINSNSYSFGTRYYNCSPSTTYYYRAYVYTKGGLEYSETYSLRTKSY